MNASRVSRWQGTLLCLCLLAVVSAVSAPLLSGQTSIPLRDGSLANTDPYLYAAEDFGIDPTSVTYHRDIAPILLDNCVKCHTTRGLAPMALTSYGEVRRWANLH